MINQEKGLGSPSMVPLNETKQSSLEETLEESRFGKKDRAEEIARLLGNPKLQGRVREGQMDEDR